MSKNNKQRKKRSARGRSKILKWLGIVLLLALAAAGYISYLVFGSNTGDMHRGNYLYIPTGADYSKVKSELEAGGFIRNKSSFDLLAKRANYPSHVHPGKYHIQKGMSNYELIRLLRSGRQTPVKLVVQKLRTKDDFARLVARNLEADSLSMHQLLNDSGFLVNFGLDTATALCGIMPDTYEFYWNSDAETVYKKIFKNYLRFWTEERKGMAAAKALTPEQVVILASIVEEETNQNEEKPIIASVYLNRLKKRMKLQADPTARYAFGDFTIRRVTSVHTAIASPYNTYHSFGLPPGPICTPETNTILAVLNATDTDYLYFCARGDGSGKHLFAKTYQEHLQNARAYHRMLNQSGIR